MKTRHKLCYAAVGVLTVAGCNVPTVLTRSENTRVPESYAASADTTNAATTLWKDYFSDPYLTALIDTALQNNQELNTVMQEIEIARSEIRERSGEYLPFAGVRAGAGVDKVARYTNIGAMEANTGIKPGREMPEPLPDYAVGIYASWEVDIWKKLRMAKQAAVMRYLASVAGRNFVVTNLIAEIAGSYYELLALDSQLDMVDQSIAIQQRALRTVRLQKENAQTTELAVRRFEAEVLNTRSLRYGIQQRITETENRINFLLGRYPQPVSRTDRPLEGLLPEAIHAGIPAQLLANRPDIQQAEQALAAAKLDVKVARARFYPSLDLSAAIGYRAFNPAFLVKTPESLLYSLVGDVTAPLINRNAIQAAYQAANAKQLQAVYAYEQTVLNAYMEVTNQLAKIANLEESYRLKSQQVQALSESIGISNTLFTSARADYFEVLLTQRDALEARFELVETKMEQLNALVNVYRALGGGWRE